MVLFFLKSLIFNFKSKKILVIYDKHFFLLQYYIHYFQYFQFFQNFKFSSKIIHLLIFLFLFIYVINHYSLFIINLLKYFLILRFFLQFLHIFRILFHESEGNLSIFPSKNLKFNVRLLDYFKNLFYFFFNLMQVFSKQNKIFN